jgi:hypothetical protein
VDEKAVGKADLIRKLNESDRKMGGRKISEGAGSSPGL